MKRFKRSLPAAAVLAGMVIGSAAFAQTMPANASGTQQESNLPAIRGVTGDPHPSAPLAGANSFTQSEAMSRIAADGVGNVQGLKQDGQSIWRGSGTKDGKQVNVALDYQGNVFIQ